MGLGTPQDCISYLERTAVMVISSFAPRTRSFTAAVDRVGSGSVLKYSLAGGAAKRWVPHAFTVESVRSFPGCVCDPAATLMTATGCG